MKQATKQKQNAQWKPRYGTGTHQQRGVNWHQTVCRIGQNLRHFSPSIARIFRHFVKAFVGICLFCCLKAFVEAFIQGFVSFIRLFHLVHLFQVVSFSSRAYSATLWRRLLGFVCWGFVCLNAFVLLFESVCSGVYRGICFIYSFV